jgi:hypothetical protein
MEQGRIVERSKVVQNKENRYDTHHFFFRLGQKTRRLGRWVFFFTTLSDPGTNGKA